MKDGRTHLAHTVEHAVDLETGAIVGVTVQDADAGDTTTMVETLITAAAQVEAVLPAGVGVAEVVGDKGYHSNETMIAFRALGLRSYVSEPDRGRRNWKGKAAAQQAVYANCRRIRGTGWHHHVGRDDNFGAQTITAGHNAFGGTLDQIEANACSDPVSVPDAVRQTTFPVTVDTTELADGVWLLGGASHNSVAIERSSRFTGSWRRGVIWCRSSASERERPWPLDRRGRPRRAPRWRRGAWGSPQATAWGLGRSPMLAIDNELEQVVVGVSDVVAGTARGPTVATARPVDRTLDHADPGPLQGFP